MTTTRAQVEAALGFLKRREGFRLRGRQPNRPGDRFALFTDLADEATFDPSLEHDAPGFVAWTAAAGRGAFDRAGTLTRPLVGIWAGDGGHVQLAFARAGLSARVERDATPREGYGASGRLTVAPDADARPSDLRALLAAFAALEADDVVALTHAPITRSAGWEDVAERARGGPAVFFTAQDLLALDAVGDLARPMHLAWRGDATRVVQALEAAGLAARAPASEGETITVTAPAGRAPRAAEPVVPPPAKTKAKRGKRAAAGPFEELARYRSPDRKPVAALALGPGDLLAVVQEGNTSGPPDRMLTVVARDTGEVRRAFATTRFAAAGRPVFLADGRLVVGLREQDPQTGRLHAFAWDPATPDAVVPIASDLNRWGEADGLVSVDAAGTHVAFTRRDGVVIHTVPPRGAPSWSSGAVVLARGACAYPGTAVGPGGAFVLWWEVDRQPLARLERERGGHSSWNVNVANARRLQLDPRGERAVFRRFEEALGTFVLRSVCARDGAEALPGLGEATRGADGFAFSPAGDLLAVGTEDGRLRLFAYPSLEVRAEQPVFAKGALSALAIDASGVVAAGSTKGELAVLRVPSASLSS